MTEFEREFGDLYVRESGTGTEPVVLLHEYFGTHQSWSAQIAVLSRYFRVIAPDLRGHGRSKMTVDGRISVADIASDVQAVRERLAPANCHLVGCSLGAVVAMNLALADPGWVTSLTLESVPSLTSESATRYGRQYIEHIFPGIESSLDRIHGQGDPGYARRLLLRNFAMDLDEQPRDHADSTALGGEIALPALIVSGELDPVFPPEAALSLSERMPDASLAVLPACGHLAHQELPDVFNSLVLDHLLRHRRDQEADRLKGPC